MDKTINTAADELMATLLAEGYDEFAIAVTFKRSDGKSTARYGLAQFSDDESLKALVRQIDRNTED